MSLAAAARPTHPPGLGEREGEEASEGGAGGINLRGGGNRSFLPPSRAISSAGAVRGRAV